MVRGNERADELSLVLTIENNREGRSEERGRPVRYGNEIMRTNRKATVLSTLQERELFDGGDPVMIHLVDRKSKTLTRNSRTLEEDSLMSQSGKVN